ncbi:chemotaxis protein CheB [Pseudoroseomonas cervicalis]|uniref:chemotaxis protein CheB n=1 Tax=Teichococcus cervicalis TaxID=204525 RepID=UPI0027841EE4|nr:chemotaxis protein CheB [Pseudoroseomonas cervicalis]MDQ1079352.1 two-component system chemotaxis response regulator CheB [Pseudoroseomonas cervicalis]
MIRVLVVDDSGFMRMALKRIIEADGDLKVVGEAANGIAALELAARLRPDVVALDVEMPELDGLAVTERLMALPSPPAVVMVSHHTRDGSEVALAALARGAVDYLWKGSALSGLDLGRIDRELRGRLRHWAAQRARALPEGETRAGAPLRLPQSLLQPAAAAAPPPPARPGQGRCDVVLLGASTGGPDAVAAFLKAAGPLPVPCLVAQHMPAELGPELVRHLAARTGQVVRLGERGLHPVPGEVVVLPGGTDGHLARAADGGFLLRLAAGPGPVHPSVDLLFQSAALVARRALAVVLTGMGRDGAAGVAALAARGAVLLLQSAASCVVAGMPVAAGEALRAAGGTAEEGEPEALGRRAATLLAPAALRL